MTVAEPDDEFVFAVAGETIGAAGVDAGVNVDAGTGVCSNGTGVATLEFAREITALFEFCGLVFSTVDPIKPVKPQIPNMAATAMIIATGVLMPFFAGGGAEKLKGDAQLAQKRASGGFCAWQYEQVFIIRYFLIFLQFNFFLIYFP